MKKQFRRKYRKVRAEFKHELRSLCQQDKTLQWFIYEAYRAENNRNNIYAIYHWLGTKHHDIWREFVKTPIWGRVITGEYGIWHVLRATYPDFAKKYVNEIPSKSAMGDALTLLCKNEQQKPQRSSENLSLKDISQEEKDLIEKLSESRLAVIDCIDAIDALAKNEAIGAIVGGLLNWHRIAEKTKHILIDDHGFTKEQIKKLEMQINLKRY